MTFRAIVIGLIGAMLIAGAGYLHDQLAMGSVLESWARTSITSGTLLPVVVLGSLILFLILVNPLLRRAGWGFRASELAIIVTLMTAACSIPARGLMQSFTGTLAMPVQYNRTLPGWRSTKVLSYVPQQMLVNEGVYDDAVIGDFLSGLKSQRRHSISPADVPWHAWRGPLTSFGPLIVLMSICAISLGLIVHRQWAYHERLRYPIAEFTNELIQQDSTGLLGSIFGNKMFWIGLMAVLSIRLLNGLSQWFPETVFQIPLSWRFDQVWSKWPILGKQPWSRMLFTPSIYPAVVGFTYFLASDVGLSLSLGHVILAPIALTLLSYGVNLQTDYMSGGSEAWQRWGSYTAYMLVLIYIGRRYYLQVVKQALTFRRGEAVENYAAWAFRVLVLAAAAASWWMIRLGLDWPLAIGTVGLILMTFVGVSRISAETGLFFIHPRWQAMGIFLGLFGTYALGPQAIILVGLMCAVLSIDPSQSLMPYFVNSLRLCSLADLKPGRVGVTTNLTYVAGVVLAVIVVLWANYNWGITRDSWGYSGVPKMAFKPAVRAVTLLRLSGQLESSEGLSPVERIKNIDPEPRFLWFAGVGFVLVLVVSWARLRYSWWPLHPVIFLVWATYPMAYFAHSFMLGWLVKRAVTHLGGHRTYINVKPLMVGVIAGDLLGGIVFMIVGVLYYMIQGISPRMVPIFPQ